jgi:hypothetical protein
VADKAAAGSRPASGSADRLAGAAGDGASHTEHYAYQDRGHKSSFILKGLPDVEPEPR